MISVPIVRWSILTEKIARRGRYILQEYTVDPHEFLQAEQVMTPDPTVLSEAMSIRNAVAYFGDGATHRTYPVVDEGDDRDDGVQVRCSALAGRR
ncbi:hypothetical protein [Sphingomonas aerolata]|uniref:hypothetical protein n=1 Tax=Sphingomonas aerolata TaxID=185951 RepID=UPI002FE32B31